MKEYYDIIIMEYRTYKGFVFPKKSSYCKDHDIQDLLIKDLLYQQVGAFSR